MKGLQLNVHSTEYPIICVGMSWENLAHSSRLQIEMSLDQTIANVLGYIFLCTIKISKQKYMISFKKLVLRKILSNIRRNPWNSTYNFFLRSFFMRPMIAEIFRYSRLSAPPCIHIEIYHKFQVMVSKFVDGPKQIQWNRCKRDTRLLTKHAICKIFIYINNRSTIMALTVCTQ